MGRSAGAGSPSYFLCSRGRRGSPLAWRDHQVVRTGATRPYLSARGSALGVRSLSVSHQYRCTCGHVGWTNHQGVLRRPVDGG
jgi:hypothetical protein